MKSARFASIVKAAGAPEVYLLWQAPDKDRKLQALARENRVMTIVQPRTGTRKDQGEVGLGQDLSGQILVFPRSLRKFEGAKIVGINYDLLKKEPQITGAKAQKKRAAKNSAPSRTPAKEDPPASRKSKRRQVPRAEPAKSGAQAKDRATKEGKREKLPPAGRTPAPGPEWIEEARDAVKKWDSGNQLPAYHLLKKIASSGGNGRQSLAGAAGKG